MAGETLQESFVLPRWKKKYLFEILNETDKVKVTQLLLP